MNNNDKATIAKEINLRIRARYEGLKFTPIEQPANRAKNASRGKPAPRKNRTIL